MNKYFVFTFGLIAMFTGNLLAQNRTDALTARLCRDVKKIKELPRDWGQKGVDKTYDSIIEGGETVIPCLIDNITNTKVMRDPRCPTISTGTTIGDVSYFVLVDLLKLDFTELLPPEIQRRYKTEGAYAYHDYVDRHGARRELQLRIHTWYADHKGKLN